MDSKKVLTHLIRAGRDALHIERTLNELGYKETPYYNLYGEIADAIYTMLGENTESFDESITHATIHDVYLADEICAEQLAKLLDDASTTNLVLPDPTREILEESAKKRGIEPASMARAILNNWAMNEMRKDTLFK